MRKYAVGLLAYNILILSIHWLDDSSRISLGDASAWLFKSAWLITLNTIYVKAFYIQR